MEPVRPKTLDEAVKWLLDNLSPADLDNFRNEEFSNLIRYHHGFGRHLRNHFGMWTDEQADFVEEVCSHAPRERVYPEDKNLVQGPHPDDASQTIIETLWTVLQARGN